MVKIQAELPVTEIIIQCEVPASQHITLHIHLLAPGRVAASRGREESVYIVTESVRHVKYKFTASVGKLAHLVTTELCRHMQAEFKFHGQFLPVTQAEHQCLAVILYILSVECSRSRKILLPFSVEECSVCQMSLQSQPVTRKWQTVEITNLRSHLRYRTCIHTFRHPSRSKVGILLQLRAYPLLASYAQPQHAPRHIEVCLLHPEF